MKKSNTQESPAQLINSNRKLVTTFHRILKVIGIRNRDRSGHVLNIQIPMEKTFNVISQKELEKMRSYFLKIEMQKAKALQIVHEHNRYR